MVSTHVDKQEFLATYPDTHTKALCVNNIKAGFAATGLVSYDPNRVLSNLHIGTGNTTPPQSDLQTNWTPETPQNITTLQMQAHAVTQSLNRGSHSPPSSVE